MSAHWRGLLFAVWVIVLTQPSPGHTQQGLGPISLLRYIIVNNVAGPKEVHEVKPYEFDPEVADRRRVEFEARHGVKGKNLVERLGLGEDGRMEERRRQQRARDREAGYLFDD